MEMHIWVKKVSNGYILTWADTENNHQKKDTMVVESDLFYSVSSKLERILRDYFKTDEPSDQ